MNPLTSFKIKAYASLLSVAFGTFLVSGAIVGCVQNDSPAPPDPVPMKLNFGTDSQLDGCQAYLVGRPAGSDIVVVRCPASSTVSTSYASGKSHHTTILVNGVSYIPDPASSAPKP